MISFCRLGLLLFFKREEGVWGSVGGVTNTDRAIMRSSSIKSDDLDEGRLGMGYWGLRVNECV
jgi:hypothetical protein